MAGLIALETKPAGEIGTLALLGIGVVHSGGTPFEDRFIADLYADLAADRDIAGTIRDCWVYATAEHPWMNPHLDPALDYLRDPPPHTVDGLRVAAGHLSTVSISGSEHMADADLLGHVLTEHRALIHKRQRPGHSFTLSEAMVDVLLQNPIPQNGQSFGDLWAASGMRAVAVATLMRDADRDPTTCRWMLLEGDPMFRMVLAMNLLAWELGENITIHDGTQHKQSLIAAYMNGEVPDFQGTLGRIARTPLEVLAGVHDEPMPRKKKGKRRG